jgi:hypothetical protein
MAVVFRFRAWDITHVAAAFGARVLPDSWPRLMTALDPIPPVVNGRYRATQSGIGKVLPEDLWR